MKVRLFAIGYGLLFILCLLWHVGTMEAQETMIRFYLIPARTDVPANVRCPEYFACGPFGTADPELTGAPYASKDYGLLPYFIVATDLTTPQQTYLDGQSNVWAFAADLSATMGGQRRNAFNAFLDGFDIPSNWITPQDTEQEAAKKVTGVFLSMQRISGIVGQNPLDVPGFSMTLQYGSLPVEWRSAIDTAMLELGLPAPGATDQIRAFLEDMADVWVSRGINFGAMGTL